MFVTGSLSEFAVRAFDMLFFNERGELTDVLAKLTWIPRNDTEYPLRL